ncbi:hypothetical protein N7481_003716 [Penicillium waksmanii]|uniref:uncharacterized protein n=1 Tax=Penicillium waksmanii TaxID=69791 RepID=UPI00254661CB|nr:uncharacterized protein N7481_003716 [Penicillium waksmanii]KAJ5988506.1 hypothetical protein N7481_003716 [Penicillium waksmanii]
MNAKVPIPRSVFPSNYTTSRRVSRACENCRDQKAKCSGHRPSCQRCLVSDARCFYGDRKREKTDRELKDLSAQVQTHKNLLRDLYPRLDSTSAQHIDQAFGGLLVRSPESFATPSDVGRTGIPQVTRDYTDEDFNRDEASQAMGFVGEHSEVTWLYRLKRDLDKGAFTPVGDMPDQPSVSSLNYFLDDLDIPVPDDIDVSVRPPQQIADRLVESYLQTIHPDFPIIGKETFLNQYQSFYSNPNVRPGKRWTAVLNLVFAIAAKHCHLLQNQCQGNYTDHLAYFARAWRLNIGSVGLLDHPNLQQVQVEGLAAFYLLSTGQVNRSWQILGIAIRSAVAMGLNLRSETDSVAHLSRETRYRVWWALFALDTVLYVMTGRPPSTGGIFCTTPLPVPYREEDFWNEGVTQLITNHEARSNLLASLLTSSKPTTHGSSVASSITLSSSTGTEQTPQSIKETPSPNISLYFLYVVDLAMLTREAIETLYAPGAGIRRSWLEMEMAISNFNTTADNWLSRLPAEFRFGEFDSTRPYIRHRISLAFRFYTTKLVISQPCLRRLAHQVSGTPSHSSECDVIATICVEAAQQMLDILPEEPDINWLYEMLPWWCFLHYIMQSTTVILVDLFTRTLPGTTEATGLTEKVQKAVRWLYAMSDRDPSAHRAWLALGATPAFPLPVESDSEPTYWVLLSKLNYAIMLHFTFDALPWF